MCWGPASEFGPMGDLRNGTAPEFAVVGKIPDCRPFARWQDYRTHYRGLVFPLSEWNLSGKPQNNSRDRVPFLALTGHSHGGDIG